MLSKDPSQSPEPALPTSSPLTRNPATPTGIPNKPLTTVPIQHQHLVTSQTSRYYDLITRHPFYASLLEKGEGGGECRRMLWGSKLNPPAWLIRPPTSFPQSINTRVGRIIGIASAAIISIIVIFTILSPRHHQSVNRDPIPGLRPYTGPPDPPKEWKPPHPLNAGSGWRPAERMIVKIKLEKEDVTWLDRIQWMWRNEVITIDEIYPHLHPKAHRVDKGRVANAYLKWIIENYHHLPETLVLLPPEELMDEGKEKTKGKVILDMEEVVFDTHSFDLDHALRHIQVPHIHNSGFINLECPSHKSQTTCNNRVLLPNKPTYELRTLEAKIPEIWKNLFGEGTPVPEQIASVLGAKIAMSKDQIQKRKLEDYLKYFEWLNKTIMDDDSSGLVFEYIWHVIFGKDAVYCPERAKCLCDLYGECS